MKKWKKERTNITEKESRKSNEKGKSYCIIWWESRTIGEESYTEWEEGWNNWKIFILNEKQERNKQIPLASKELQSEISWWTNIKKKTGWNVTLAPGKHGQYLHYRNKW